MRMKTVVFMYADMRNSYLRDDCAFEFNILTGVLSFLDAYKRIHHIIKKATMLWLYEGRPYKYVPERAHLKSVLVNVAAPLSSTVK
jgi:hypothetical protein